MELLFSFPFFHQFTRAKSPPIPPHTLCVFLGVTGGWVGFLVSVLVGLSPLKAWLKHMFPPLWPEEGNEAIPKPETEITTFISKTDAFLDRFLATLTNFKALRTSFKEREA